AAPAPAVPVTAVPVTAVPVGYRYIERALRARRPDRAALEAPFAPLERRAHQLLPRLAAIRPALGSTPLVAVPSRGGRGTVWLKAEAANLTGTVKARTAYALLCAAVARAGTPAVRLAEYSGGSLALALAEMCALLGLDVHLAVPYGSPERLTDALRRYGAQVTHAPQGTGFLGAMDEAARIAEREERHLLLQHCAPEAVAVHREQTGAEIVARLAREGIRPGVLAASVGSAGTLTGTAQALRARWPGCRVTAVFPAEAPYGDTRAPDGTRRMSGTGGLGHGLRQPLLAPYEDGFAFAGVCYPQALKAMSRLRRTQQIAVCSSAAGAWLSASRVIDEDLRGGHAVAVAAGRGTTEEWDHAAGH
ncbi:pyridoxal-phosphate dependent enzyme, partial [Streptomyces europaeiscabiei]|uniref:pyridoxal-phosphate dependent enzyme n=1 Tax=Streptomyces europaeiscabiei TaxID=146819 RepID=UPI0029A378E0